MRWLRCSGEGPGPDGAGHCEREENPGGLNRQSGPEVGGVRGQERLDRERDDVAERLPAEERPPGGRHDSQQYERTRQEKRDQLPEAVHGGDVVPPEGERADDDVQAEGVNWRLYSPH